MPFFCRQVVSYAGHSALQALMPGRCRLRRTAACGSGFRLRRQLHAAGHCPTAAAAAAV